MKHELEILRQGVFALKCPVSVALDEPNLLFYLSILILIKTLLLRLEFKGSQSLLCFNELIDAFFNIKSNLISTKKDRNRVNFGKSIFQNLQNRNIEINTQKSARNKANNSIEFLNNCIPLKLPNGDILPEELKLVSAYIQNLHLKQTLNNPKKRNRKQPL